MTAKPNTNSVYALTASPRLHRDWPCRQRWIVSLLLAVLCVLPPGFAVQAAATRPVGDTMLLAAPGVEEFPSATKASALATIYAELQDIEVHFPVPQNTVTIQMGTFNMTIGSVLLLVLLLIAGFAAADCQRREMQAALAAERLETARMTGELKAAHDIQLGMVPLPGTIEGLPDTLDFHALLEPAEAVGGDLYDAFMLDAHHLCFLIGDVTCKGVPAALFMALSKTLYRSTAMRAHLALHALMRAVNAEIARENPAHLFVSLLAGLLDTRTGALELCRAGHVAPILLRQGAVPRVLDIPGGPPLCVLDDFPYVTDHMQLQEEDLLILVTDGVTEAQDAYHTFYGQERTVAYLNALHQGATGALSAAAVCQGLYDNVQGFMHGAPVSDDITIVVIRFMGLGRVCKVWSGPAPRRHALSSPCIDHPTVGAAPTPFTTAKTHDRTSR